MRGKHPYRLESGNSLQPTLPRLPPQYSDPNMGAVTAVRPQQPRPWTTFVCTWRWRERRGERERKRRRRPPTAANASAALSLSILLCSVMSSLAPPLEGDKCTAQTIINNQF